MTVNMTCNTFQHQLNPYQHLWKQDGNSSVSSRLQDCSDYIKDTFSAYLAAVQHLGRRWSVNDLVELNLMLRGPSHKFEGPTNAMANANYSAIVARDAQMEADFNLRDLQELASLKVSCANFVPASENSTMDGYMCAPLSEKPRLLQRYLDEFYLATDGIAPPQDRSPEAWNLWLVALETFFVRLYELHPLQGRQL
eukprot:SRR837773.14335.p2 GENE.SRR837773.14335~~SRR837773.14335.p2  ORF type:complete len:196 (-),score=44.32 SRR837773.14335:99-686(-)